MFLFASMKFNFEKLSTHLEFNMRYNDNANGSLEIIYICWLYSFVNAFIFNYFKVCPCEKTKLVTVNAWYMLQLYLMSQNISNMWGQNIYINSLLLKILPIYSINSTETIFLSYLLWIQSSLWVTVGLFWPILVFYPSWSLPCEFCISTSSSNTIYILLYNLQTRKFEDLGNAKLLGGILLNKEKFIFEEKKVFYTSRVYVYDANPSSQAWRQDYIFRSSLLNQSWS